MLKKFGLSTNYLSDIERGKSSARLDKLVAIINSLECSADDVFVDVIKCGGVLKLHDCQKKLNPYQQMSRKKSL